MDNSKSGLLPVILIDGPIGTGVSTIAKFLARNFTLHHLQGGTYMRDLCIKSGVCKAEQKSFQFQKELNNFLTTVVAQNPQVDTTINQVLVQQLLQTKAPTVIEGKYLAPYATLNNISVIIKIWVNTSLEDRIRHLKEKYGVTDQVNDTDVQQIINERDTTDQQRYLSMLNIDLSKPEQYYDLIINTQGQTVEQTYQTLTTHATFTEKIKNLVNFFPDYSSEWRSWKCGVCNYVYEGNKTILICPRCGNSDPDKFGDL